MAHARSGAPEQTGAFLCDRDALRKQAWEKIAMAFPKGSVRLVETDQGQNAAKNAKVHIATYQTLGLDDADDGYASFLTRHYPPNAFSVIIIIDECHSSAWGRWSEVLQRNPQAIQIGLSATPRQLREAKHQTPDDASISANNLAYFGEPVYEYTLSQAQEDGYLAACEIVKLKPIDARTGKYILAEDLKTHYVAKNFDDDILLPERIAAMCADLFARLCEHGGPEQKVIIFCTRDLHADRVALQMQRLYAAFTAAARPRVKKPGGDDEGGEGGDDDPLPLPEIVGGQAVTITPQGRYIL
ncbi:MAG: DEAD/DEAH box helicase family protein, partial [Polaromonas sp.]